MCKLTPEIQEKLCNLLKLGVPQKYACEACGIDETTFCRWMKLGRHKTEGKYFEFHQSVIRTNSEAMSYKLAALEKASQKGNVSAITWFLEHKYPDIFGNKIHIEHSGKINFEQLRELLKSNTSPDTKDIHISREPDNGQQPRVDNKQKPSDRD
jgi:hypothetical protein